MGTNGVFGLNIRMKTLREYIDQLDEISRRDFLKGAGAIGAAGAAGLGGWSAGYTTARDRNYEWDLGFLDGFLAYPMVNKIDSDLIVDIKQRVAWHERRIGNRHEEPKYRQGYEEGNKAYKKMFPNGHFQSPADKNKFAGMAEMMAKRITDSRVYEEHNLEEASPDAVKRIEELVKYK